MIVLSTIYWTFVDDQMSVIYRPNGSDLSSFIRGLSFLVPVCLKRTIRILTDSYLMCVSKLPFAISCIYV